MRANNTHTPPVLCIKLTSPDRRCVMATLLILWRRDPTRPMADRALRSAYGFRFARTGRMKLGHYTRAAAGGTGLLEPFRFALLHGTRSKSVAVSDRGYQRRRSVSKWVGRAEIRGSNTSAIVVAKLGETSSSCYVPGASTPGKRQPA
jgi:hypothetical protein